MTGRPKPTGEPYTLPPRAGPRPTEAEIAEAEHRAFCCDDDGHECIPYPPPIPQDYGSDPDAYRSARAAWEDAERARIERARPREACRLDRAPARAAPPARRHRAAPRSSSPKPWRPPARSSTGCASASPPRAPPWAGITRPRRPCGRTGSTPSPITREPTAPSAPPPSIGPATSTARPPDLGRGRTALAGGRAQATASASARSPQALRPGARRSLGALTPFSAIRPPHRHAVRAVWRGMRRWQETGMISSHPGPPRRALQGRVIHKGVRGIHLGESR